MIKINQNDVTVVEDIACRILQFPLEGCYKWDCKGKTDRFKAIFGVPSIVISAIWKLARDEAAILDITIEHLLWGLVHLKVYDTEDTHLRIVGWPKGGKKEFRKKSWQAVELIADQKNKVVRLEKQFKNAPIQNGNRSVAYLVSDMTDCHINEPKPFEPKWKSEKFNGPGLTYIVAVANYSDNICLAEGPWPAATSESKCTKQALLSKIARNEPVEVDSGPGKLTNNSNNNNNNNNS